MTPEEQRQFTLMQEELVRLRSAMAALGGATGSAGKAASALLGPFASLFDATTKGATGLSAYNTILDQSKEELNKFIGFSSTFGTIMNKMGEAGIGYVKMTTIMADELMKGYQGFSAVGAAGKADLMDTYETFRKFGAVTTADFPKITQMIAENGDTLAKLGGTMARGVTQFANLAASVQQSGLQTEFLAMGMTVDGINKGLTGYLKTITQTGQAQKMTQDQVNAGAAEYIRNLDVLSKLTGKSADVLQKERDERMQDELYRLQLREQQKVVDRGGAEGARMAQTMKDNEELLGILRNIDPKLEKAAMRALGPAGTASAEGRQLLQTDPELYRLLAERNRGGTASNEEILAQGARGAKAYVDTFGSLALFGGKAPGLDMVPLMGLENRGAGQTARDAAAAGAGKTPTTATQDAKDQQEAQRKQADATVGVMVEIIQKQRQAAQDLSDMSTLGIVPVGNALSVLAGKIKEFTEMLPGARPLTKAQREEQAGGESVGRSDAAPGVTSDTIKRRADEDLAEITRLIKESAGKAGVAAGSTLDAVITGIGDLLKRRQDQVVPVPVPQDNNQNQNQNLGPRSLVSGIVENLSASVSRGYVNIASVDNIRFPEMTTSYRTSLDPDMMNRVAGFANSRETTTETASTALRDSDLIASNVLVSQKLDDLIDVMRRGVGYQRKISNQAYA